MNNSRASTHTTAKANRPTLHARKFSSAPQDQDPREPTITKARLSSVAFDSSGRHEMIENLAYYYAESRGFISGHELEDWLAAETEIDARLIAESRAF